MTERHLSCGRRRGALAAIVLAIVFCAGGPVFAVDWSAPAGTLDYKMVSLTHISPEQGRELLTTLGLGTASRLPGTNSLLVTAEAGVLRKAVTVLNLVDTRVPYEIARLGPATAAPLMPSNQQIAEAVGNITIGTFACPPRGLEKTKALLDVQAGAIWAIAPAAQLAEIKRAVELGPDVLKERKAVNRYAQAGAAAPMLQAADMTGGVKAGKTIQPDNAPASVTVPNPPTQTALSQDAQQKILSPAPQPLSAAMPDLAPVPSEASFGQSSDSDTTASDRALQPGQPVPSRSGRISEPHPNSIDTALQASKTQARTTSRSAAEPVCYEPEPFANGDQVINLTLPPQIPIIQLLDLAGKYLNLSYIYDPAKVTGDVTLKLNGNLQGQMKVKDLYGILEEALQSKDLVMTRRKDNIVRIVPKSEYTEVLPEIVSPDSRTVEAGDTIVTRVFELKHVDTNGAENFLQQMGLAVGVTSVADKGTLVVTAYAHRMARIEQLLEMVDKPGEPRKFRYRQLRYTMAQSLAEKVKALAEQLQSVTITVGDDSAVTTPQVAKLAGETEAAYRARLARIAVARQAAQARSRPTQTPETPKPTVYLDADERTNRILMIGIDEQLDVVEDLVDTLDVQQQELRTLELYRIRHVDAGEVAQKLQELGIISKLPESSTPGRITGPTRTAASQAVTQSGRPVAPTPEAPSPTEVTEGGIVGEPQVVVIESTNSLLVNATPEQHAQIGTIIEYVDSQMEAGEIPYKIYPLENSSPDHLAEVLESLIQETVEQQDKEGKIETTVISREEKIKIVPDPNTYSLIVYANKKNQEWIKSLIQQLDKRRPQVLIDVTLVEITQTDKFNYDLNAIKSFPNLAATSGLTGVIAGTGDSAITSGGIMEKLRTAGKDEFIDFQSNSGSFTAFYGDRHIHALLTAMKSKNYGRVLAKPKILVNDNEQGNITTKDTTYVKTTSAIPISSGAAGTQENLIQTSVNYQGYDAGITLDITPHISEGDLLRLDIELTRSDFRETPAAPADESQPPPNTTTSEVKTGVTVPDGKTAILGGLIRLNQNKGGNKVPILGDIPLVGGLFRSIENNDNQSMLYVFVKAEIIRPATGPNGGMQSLDEVSQRNQTAFERHELKFQQYQDWPGVKATPMGPEKVLEAE